ncbi:MAG: CsgG/HfaB family protein [Thermodesulfobacteriota bacterium]|nr:CsgG/HfaB family protein [Thermodesulfobacteriota bacterium]
MKTRNFLILLITLAIILHSALTGAENARTLAILPFENNSVTDARKYDPLCNGLSVMLMTELSNVDTDAFKLIEREKIRALLEEISLGQTGAVDPSTAARVGKLLGAQTTGFGAFMVLGKQVRIDMRIIRVETGELIMAESITGEADEFLFLEQKLAQKIAVTMNTRLAQKASASKSSIEAALFFAQGVEALEKGNKARAEEFFNKSMALDPSYKDKIDRLK